MNRYSINIDLNVLNHLGINLYSKIPAVLSETIANSYDADASRVELNISENEIVIIDNGCGMSEQEINDRFLTVGYKKRNDIAETPLYKRKPMGRKGIGKLSLFSIANVVEVHSFNGKNEKQAFVINVATLKEFINNPANKGESYHPEEIEPNICEQGTKIILREIRKNRTIGNIDKIKKEIARRFNVFDENFVILINGDKITFKNRKYFEKVSKIYKYGDSSIDFKKECQNLRYDIEERTCKINSKYSISGWIGFVESPADLKDDIDNINKIFIFARGKMGQEDILSSIKSSSNYNQYIIGEINADFLDDYDDLAVTSREGFNEESEEYLDLKSFIDSEIKYIGKDWNEIKASEGVVEAKKIIPDISSWYDNLGPDDKTTAKKLFGKVNQITMDKNQKKSVLANVVLAFEKSKYNNELKKLENMSSDSLAELGGILSGFKEIEASYYYNIIKQRLDIVKQLDEKVLNNDKEKFIQRHLAENLWLLDPTWDEVTNDVIMEKNLYTALDVQKDKNDDDKNFGRIDIRLKTSSTKYVIIELKRPDRVISSDEAIKQLNKYCTKMDEIITSMNLNKNFEIILVVGKFIDNNKDSETNRFKESIKSYNAKVVHYDELISNSTKIYKDYLSVNEKFEKVLPILQILNEDDQ